MSSGMMMIMMIIMTPAYYTIQRVETYRYDKRAITHKSAAMPGREARVGKVFMKINVRVMYKSGTFYF